MIVEPFIPKELKKIQHWFGSIILRPIDENNRIMPLSPRGKPIQLEAVEHILPSFSLTSSQRIEIYNQQYWWRLLTHLQDSFPFLLRLFGHSDFNQKIGFPYLSRYNPNHWSLNVLGSRLPFWVQRYYHGEDKALVSLAAKIDLAFSLSFIAQQMTPVSSGDLEGIMDTPLYLQPSIYLFSVSHSIFEFRDKMLAESPEYWIENDFPPLEKTKKSGYMVWRDCNNSVGWYKMESAEFNVFRKISKGITFNHLCEWIEEQPTWIYNSAAAQLDNWTKRWVINEWLTAMKS